MQQTGASALLTKANWLKILVDKDGHERWVGEGASQGALRPQCAVLVMSSSKPPAKGRTMAHCLALAGCQPPPAYLLRADLEVPGPCVACRWAPACHLEARRSARGVVQQPHRITQRLQQGPWASVHTSLAAHSKQRHLQQGLLKCCGLRCYVPCVHNSVNRHIPAHACVQVRMCVCVCMCVLGEFVNSTLHCVSL